MSYESITVTPVSPHIGAEIGNIDLTKPLPNKQVEELHKAFVQYQVIFFRDQKISFDDQIRLGRYFRSARLACRQVDHQQDDGKSVRPQIPLRRNLASRSPARTSTATSPARKSRRSAAFSTITRCRRMAAAIRCSPRCMRLTMRCRRA